MILINTLIGESFVAYLPADERALTVSKIENQRDQATKIVQTTLDTINEREFDEIAVINGPGSFTSIRVAIALAKGISVATNKKIKSISAFEYLLHSTENLDQKNCNYFLTILNSGKENSFFIQIFSNEKKVITNGYEYSLDDIKELLKSYEKTCIISDIESDELKNLENISDFKFFTFEESNLYKLKEFLSTKETINSNQLQAYYIRPHYAKKSEK